MQVSRTHPIFLHPNFAGGFEVEFTGRVETFLCALQLLSFSVNQTTYSCDCDTRLVRGNLSRRCFCTYILFPPFIYYKLKNYYQLRDLTCPFLVIIYIWLICSTCRLAVSVWGMQTDFGNTCRRCAPSHAILLYFSGTLAKLIK